MGMDSEYQKMEHSRIDCRLQCIYCKHSRRSISFIKFSFCIRINTRFQRGTQVIYQKAKYKLFLSFQFHSIEIWIRKRLQLTLCVERSPIDLIHLQINEINDIILYIGHWHHHHSRVWMHLNFNGSNVLAWLLYPLNNEKKNVWSITCIHSFNEHQRYELNRETERDREKKKVDNHDCVSKDTIIFFYVSSLAMSQVQTFNCVCVPIIQTIRSLSSMCIGTG